MKNLWFFFIIIISIIIFVYQSCYYNNIIEQQEHRIKSDSLTIDTLHRELRHIDEKHNLESYKIIKLLEN